MGIHAEIQLTPAEIFQGAIAGVMRHTQNIQQGKKPTYGISQSVDWQAHIDGALSEMAVAKYLGVYWSGKGGIGDPDVLDMDVRSSHRDDASLIMHDHDDDERKFWLITGLNGKYKVRGWIYGRDGKQDKYLKDPQGGRPAYFIPQSDLRGDC